MCACWCYGWRSCLGKASSCLALHYSPRLIQHITCVIVELCTPASSAFENVVVSSQPFNKPTCSGGDKRRHRADRYRLVGWREASNCMRIHSHTRTNDNVIMSGRERRHTHDHRPPPGWLEEQLLHCAHVCLMGGLVRPASRKANAAPDVGWLREDETTGRTSMHYAVLGDMRKTNKQRDDRIIQLSNLLFNLCPLESRDENYL